MVVAEGAIRGIAGRPTMLKRYMGTVDEDPDLSQAGANNSPFETAAIRFPSQRPGRMNVPRTRGRCDPPRPAWAASTFIRGRSVPRTPTTPMSCGSTSIPLPGSPSTRCAQAAVAARPLLRRDRAHRMAEDVGESWHPRLRPDRAVVGLLPDPASRPRLRPRVGAPDAGPGDHQVVERGAARGCSSTTTRTPGTRASHRRTA